MKIEFVQQQCDKSCGIAVAAMAAGVSFETAAQLYGPKFRQNGMTAQELDALLAKLGVEFKRQMTPEINGLRPYIISIPSLNVRGGMHYVVVDLSNGLWELHDPQRGRPGKAFYSRLAYAQQDPDGGEQVISYAEVIEILGRRPGGGRVI